MLEGYDELTDREKQTLRMLLVGHDAKSIAREFNISVHIVNERLRDARRKLSTSSSKEAARRLREIELKEPKFLGDRSFGLNSPTALAQPDEQRHAAPHLLWRARWVIGAVTMLILAVLAAVALSPMQHEPMQALPHDPLTDSFMEPTATPTALRDERAKLLAESRDAPWAAQTETMLRSRYSSTLSAAGPTASLRVTCARSLCEIAAMLPPVGEIRINAAMQALQSIAFSDPGIVKGSGVAFSQSRDAPASVSLLAYWSRFPTKTAKPSS